MAQATALNAAAQQLSVATGVAMVGAILESVASASGGLLTQTGFAIAFLIIGFISAFGALPFWTMHPSAGSEVSGHSLGEAKLDKPLP